MKIELVLIDAITQISSALRTPEQTDGKIISLAKDISVRGLLNPFSVSAQPDGTYKLIDGAHRLTAIRLNRTNGVTGPDGDDFSKVAVSVKEDMDDNQILADQIAANFNINKTTNMEYVRALYKITVNEDPTTRISLDELSEKIGVSVQTILSWFKMLKLPENIGALVGKKLLSTANAIRLSDICRKVDEDELEALTEEAQTLPAAEFTAKVETRLKELRAGKKTSSEPIFTPTKKLIAKAQLETLLDQAQTAFDQNGTVAEEAVLNLMKTIFSIDDKSVAEQKAAWDKAQADKKTRAASRASEKTAKQFVALAEELKAAGIDPTTRL